MARGLSQREELKGSPSGCTQRALCHPSLGKAAAPHPQQPNLVRKRRHRGFGCLSPPPRRADPEQGRTRRGLRRLPKGSEPWPPRPPGRCERGCGGEEGAGPVPAAARAPLSAASFRWHLSSRNELPAPRSPARAAAAHRGGSAAEPPPSERPLLPPPARARLPRPPAHSSSQ